MHKKLSGLYAITDEVLTPDTTVIQQVQQALEAGVKIIQYRNKTALDSDVEELCHDLQTLCHEYEALFILDDRPYLAAKLGVDGLHIGKDDMPLDQAREVFSQGIIGVSCYGSVKKALQAQEQGADYVAFGSFYPSPTKPLSGVVNKSVVTKAKELLAIPICVIGGINHSNIEEMLTLHPDMISVVSAVFDGDIRLNVAQLLEKICK